MGGSKKGDVYRFDWMTLVPLGQKLFKLVSNSGTEVQQVHGTDADTVRDAVQETLTSMSPQFGLSRDEKMKLNTSRVSLSFVSHMRHADISQDNSNAYKGTVLVPCCFYQGSALARRQRQWYAILLRLPSVQENHEDRR